MKKLNLTGIVILCSLLLSCPSKKETIPPKIYFENQNYKFDDEAFLNKKTQNSKEINTQP
jgi:major membrane immunogen (membrane-anchored lipoprotein)